MFTSPWRHQAAAEAARRRRRESTYTQPLGMEDAAISTASSGENDLVALQTFLKEFYPTFYSRPNSAARQQLLDSHPEVAEHHMRLVGHAIVSPEEFWQRYAYRCDEQRILQEWDRHPTRGRKIMGAAMSTWLTAKVDAVKKTVATTTTTAVAAPCLVTEESTNTSASDSASSIISKGEETSSIGKKKNVSRTSYVIPQRRRDKGVSNSTSNAQSLQSDASTTTSTTSRTTTSSMKPSPSAKSSQQSKEGETISSKQHYSYATLLFLCFLVGPFFIKGLLSQRMNWCAGPTVDLDSAAFGHKAQSFLCRGIVHVPSVDTSSGKKKKNQKQKVKFQRNSEKQNKDHSHDRNNLNSKPSGSATALYSDNAYGGNDVGGNDILNGDDNGGLVQSLISSWMQNTDMAQFENYGGGMMSGSGGSFWGSSSGDDNNNNNQALARPEQDKKGGLVGFFQQRFRRNQPSHALATPAQPQMVVHQHIHHVVHHVVHEVKQS